MKIISISDVITNSSSEVFIIHAKPEFQEEINQEVPEFLNQLCELANEDINKIMEFDIADETYIDDDWYYYVHKNDLIIYSVSDNTIPYWIMELIQSLETVSKFKDKFGGYYAEDLGEKELPYYNLNHKKDEPALQVRKVKIESIQRHHLG